MTLKQRKKRLWASKTFQITLALRATVPLYQALTVSSESDSLPIMLSTSRQASSRSMFASKCRLPVAFANAYNSLADTACKQKPGDLSTSWDKKLTNKDADEQYKNSFDGYTIEFRWDHKADGNCDPQTCNKVFESFIHSSSQCTPPQFSFLIFCSSDFKNVYSFNVAF